MEMTADRSKGSVIVGKQRAALPVPFPQDVSSVTDFLWVIV